MEKEFVYDIAIVGSGFGGSLLAMIARRLGHSVILLEKNRHPRFAIGESTTPLSNILLETLATRYGLAEIAPLSKWGSWQRACSQVACGLKRGFTFYHHTLGEAATVDPLRQRQLLVAASPHDEIADTHWFRADVDDFFVQQAQKLGVAYLDEACLDSVEEREHEIRLSGRRRDEPISIRARFLVDATGPRGFLHHALKLSEAALPSYPATQAVFSHFTGVARLDDEPLRVEGAEPPYPVDDAAVHHVFDGGWIWVLKFNNRVTSAGVAATDEVAEQLKFCEGAAAWKRVVEQIPVLARQFADAKAIRSFSYMPRVAFRSGAIVGRRWALLSSAAGFVDPLLSTGFPLTLLGVGRLAEIIERHWDSPQFAEALQTYAKQTDDELLAAAGLIGSLYSSMNRFPVFAALSMLYFAAASFSESARRLGKAQLASSFLLHDNPVFGPAALRAFELASRVSTEAEMLEFTEEISRLIAPFNVAGLADARRRNWYPVEAEDLLNAATKVESSREEIMQSLERCGFWKSVHAAI